MDNASRFLIGIDLGTTNTVLGYIDTQEGPDAQIRVFAVPQVLGPGEVRALPTLPSFLYFPTEDELATGSLSLPWDEHPRSLAGTFAREQGALLPGRQISSAKSWLVNGSVNRRGRILPREAEAPEVTLSPVEASAHYLVHLRHAWNRTMANGHPQDFLENQEIVLTVPASFDEEARELTVEAAQQAGLTHLTLLEEPLAAFYAWIAEHRETMHGQVADNELILICDIGGGTTDFSLVRARVTEAGLQFDRLAIGEHLLLGGDNLDLALMYRIAERIGAAKLGLRQRLAARRLCCAAKEKLLGESAPEQCSIIVPGSGSTVVGQALRAELSREEVVEILTSGFLPLTAGDEGPVRGQSAGLRELELPYAGDPAITRHLAAFLSQAAISLRAQPDLAPVSGTSHLVRPDAILFNGGFCAPPIARQRIAAAVANWFSTSGSDWRPRILPTEAVESAVATGAAYYGRVRRGLGVRIRAGSARTYYIGLRSEQAQQGVCVLAAGVEEGTELPPSGREFTVLANRPVSFTLYSSRVRHDSHGSVISLEGEEIHRHAPLVSLLRYGKRMRELELAVKLRAYFTEMGTLELWCEAANSPHRWRLQFELRGDERQTLSGGRASAPATSKPSDNLRPGLPPVRPEGAETAAQLLRAVFGSNAEASGDEAVSPDTLVARIESDLGLRRERWPIGLIRPLADLLTQLAEGRKRSPRHEVRWLSLMGLCLRPGFGAPGDELRIRQLRPLQMNGPAFPGELQAEVEDLILWRRIAGGLNASHQHELHRRLASSLNLGSKKKSRMNRQVERESWRLLATLEHLSSSTRTSLGTHLLTRALQEADEGAWLWALARLGARIPLYGPMSCVVAPQAAELWVKTLLDLSPLTAEIAYAIAQIGRFTGDSHRDIDDSLREAATERLTRSHVGEDLLPRLRSLILPDATESARMFGEPLPPELRLVSSASCLLSLPALA